MPTLWFLVLTLRALVVPLERCEDSLASFIRSHRVTPIKSSVPPDPPLTEGEIRGHFGARMCPGLGTTSNAFCVTIDPSPIKVVPDPSKGLQIRDY